MRHACRKRFRLRAAGFWSASDDWCARRKAGRLQPAARRRFSVSQNVNVAPLLLGIGTRTTFDRSLTTDPDPVVLLRQSPAHTKNPIVSPTAGWCVLIGPHRIGS